MTTPALRFNVSARMALNGKVLIASGPRLLAMPDRETANSSPRTASHHFSLNVRRSGKMKIGSVVIYCYEFDKMVAFWQQALHYVPREPAKDGFVILRDPAGRGPDLSLDQEGFRKRSGKRSKLHLDLYTTDQEREVERLIAIGATRYPWRYPPNSDFVVLEDPDGNLFCVVQAAETKP
jgi:hypothetical protein